jgi:hypothetical protein
MHLRFFAILLWWGRIRSKYSKEDLWDLTRVYISTIIGFFRWLKWERHSRIVNKTGNKLWGWILSQNKIYIFIYTHCSSVATELWPPEPQSLDGPFTLAQAKYQRLACNRTGWENKMGYRCRAPHSYTTSSVSAINSPSPSCSPPLAPRSKTYFINI